MSADAGSQGFTEDPFDTHMDGARLIGELFAAANPANAQPMAKYMRDQFPFLGIPGTVRKPIERPYLAVARKDPHPDWAFIAQCWALPHTLSEGRPEPRAGAGNKRAARFPPMPA